MKRMLIIAYALLSSISIYSMKLDDSPINSPKHIRIPRNSTEKSVEVDTELANLGLPNQEVKNYTDEDIEAYLKDHPDVGAPETRILTKLKRYLNRHSDDEAVKSAAIKLMNGIRAGRDVGFHILMKALPESFYREEDSDSEETSYEDLNTTYHKNKAQAFKKIIKNQDESIEAKEKQGELEKNILAHNSGLRIENLESELKEAREKNQKLESKDTVLRDHDQKLIDTLLKEISKIKSDLQELKEIKPALHKKLKSEAAFRKKYKEAYDQWVLWEKKCTKLKDANAQLKKIDNEKAAKIKELNSEIKKLSNRNDELYRENSRSSRKKSDDYYDSL